jgi:hypothetical protein
MFDSSNPELMWLNITNALLGLVTLTCLAAVAWAVVVELRQRARVRANATVLHDDHAFVLSDLGITMADGGERIDESSHRKASNDLPNDPPNIIRSNN